MSTLTVLKFSSEDCGTCHRMSHYDAKVAEELGLVFVSVMLQDTDTYRLYRKVLMAQYPCLLYTSPSPRDLSTSRMPSSA